MAVTLTIGGQAVAFDEGTFTIIRKVNERMRLQCTVLDYTGTLVLQYGEQVVATDATLGVIFSGFLIDDKKDKSKSFPDPLVEHQIDTIDARVLADNRTTSRQYTTPTNTGKIVLDLWADALQYEGINAYASTRYDTTQAMFAQGTLSGTQATLNVGDGDLELTPAGSIVAVSESTTAQFSTGTLTNMTTTSNMLTPTTVNALKMQSTLSFSYGTEFAQAQPTISGTASGTAAATVGSSGSYTPSGTIFISGGNPGESASFSGSTGSVSSSGSFSTPVTSTLSGNASQPYTPKTKSKVRVDATHYNVVSVDASVTDNRADATIWTGSFIVASNDTLSYDIWISSSSPSQEGGIDLFFSDGTQLTEYLGTLDSNTDTGIWDQNGLSVSPIQDLSDAAKDTWYTRQISLSILVGKTITSVSVFNAANVAGNFDLYIKNCYLGSQSGSPFFGTAQTAPSVNPPTISTIGAYINSATLVTVARVYIPVASSRVSPAYSIDAMKMAKTSIITWAANNPVLGPAVVAGSQGAATVAGSEAIFVSYDGTTWLPCTNNAPLPGLPAGANVAGVSLYLLETFTGGQDPTAIPSLANVNIILYPAIKATTTDAVAQYGSAATWNTGTELGTAPNSNGDLALGSTSYSWSGLTGMTYIAGNYLSSNPAQSVSSGAYIITSTGDSWSSSRFNFISAVRNFTAQADFTLNSGSNPYNQIGFVYRQNYWGGSPDFYYAYYVGIFQTPVGVSGGPSVYLAYGIDNPTASSMGGGAGTGTFNIIQQVTETVTDNTTYHLKLVVSENRHRVYWNNGTTPIIDVLDNTYTAAGNIGVRTYVQCTSPVTSKIANFSITSAYAGLWTSPSLSLSSLGTCGYTQVSWSEVTPPGTTQSTAIVMASLNGGTTWQQCTNGAVTPTANIPGLTLGTNVSGKSLLIQVILSASTYLSNPIITGLRVHVCGAFPSVTGMRNTAPMGNDTQITRTVGSGWGPAFDGQVWTQVGTGATAVGSGEATITNTTGTVYMRLGTRTGTDLDGTHRFSLSSSSETAGIFLRYVDTNNYYALAATTSGVSILKRLSGVTTTLATVSMALTVNTECRMRFRVAGSAPVSLFGNVWADGSLEPTVNALGQWNDSLWSLVALD